MPPAQARRVLIVANPVAGLKSGRDAGEVAARAAEVSGARVELQWTRNPGDARRLAEAAQESDFDLLIAAGGDGTVNEAANGVAGSALPLAVAPAGTMNILARVLGLPLDPGEAVRRVVPSFGRLSVRPGDASGRLFLLMAGCGFDAWVLRELLHGASGKIGFAHYVRGALRSLRTFPFTSLTIVNDGATIQAHTAIVGRAPLYGGFLRPTPGADLEREALELCAIAGGRAHLVATLPRFWFASHAGRSGVTLAPAHRVAIAAEDGNDVPYQIDGELVGSLPVAIALSGRILVLAIPGGGR